jgi:hypothetical protein
MGIVQAKEMPAKATVFVFMDTIYGAVVSRYSLKLNGVELPQIYGYKYFQFEVDPGTHVIDASREGVGGTTLHVNLSENETRYVYVDPVGFPRPTPVLRLVNEARGQKGVASSSPLPVPVSALAQRSNKGVLVAGPTKMNDVRFGAEDGVYSPEKVADTQVQDQPKPKSPERLALSRPNRKALVIGNDSYQAVPKLLNAGEDARTIASNLSALGYAVTLKTDLTEKEMKATLRTFAGQVLGGDEVLFYFAGHGVQLGMTNYLLPTDIVGDSEAQVRDEAIPLQRVLDDMADRKAKFALAVIDACRDNPFKSTGRSIGGRGLAPTNAATGQMVIFSAGTGQQALDSLGRDDKVKNGVFTRVFIQEMQKPSLSIDRVMKNVRNQVAEMARSVGHEQVPAIYDQVLGDFFFTRP